MLFKLSNLNSNLALTLGYLNPALNNSALKNCKSLSVADLVVYMEKEKSKLRKLKRNFWRVRRG